MDNSKPFFPVVMPLQSTENRQIVYDQVQAVDQNIAPYILGTSSPVACAMPPLMFQPFQPRPFVFNHTMANRPQIYSRKVFVGGLPPDIDEDDIRVAFQSYGVLLVDWPHKSDSKSPFPPKGPSSSPSRIPYEHSTTNKTKNLSSISRHGDARSSEIMAHSNNTTMESEIRRNCYAFLIFETDRSVEMLLEQCWIENGKHFAAISSPSIKEKPVQIRAWELRDIEVYLDPGYPIDLRMTVFVGGVPRPMKAGDLGKLLNDLVGGVVHAMIDVDQEYKYPKGAGRVSFNNKMSFQAAITARFIDIKTEDMEKQVEVKPYVLEDQQCDHCHGAQCAGRCAPFFCAHVTCLSYLCEACWPIVHSQSESRKCHKPVIKEKSVRPRGASGGRWNKVF